MGQAIGGAGQAINETIGGAFQATGQLLSKAFVSGERAAPADDTAQAPAMDP